MKTAVSILVLACASGCGIPVRESYWQPAAPGGELQNYSTCDLGGADSLQVALGNGVRLETHAESSEGEFIATFYLYGTVKARPVVSTVSLSSGEETIDVPLTLKTSKDALDPIFECRAPFADNKVVIATLPTFTAGGGHTVSIPPITYRFGAHAIMKCLNM
jgi:hypothetical protein